MPRSQPAIQPVRLADMPAITRMVYANMTGVDEHFTRLTKRPSLRLVGYLFLPFYFWFSGRGYKAVDDGRLLGYAYLYLRSASGYVFNVSVNEPFRRQGVGRALMADLERRTGEQGRPWSALHVDAINEPARSFYGRLGYRAYHPHFLRRARATDEAGDIAPGLSLQPLGSRGRSYFAEMAALERREGDGWAAAVVSNEYAAALPTAGRFWRCTWQGQEVGCVWAGEKRDRRPSIVLLFRPDFWGHALTPPLVRRVAGEGTELDVYLGSSAHFERAAAVLAPFDFTPQTERRILMLKRLDAAGPPAGKPAG